MRLCCGGFGGAPGPAVLLGTLGSFEGVVLWLRVWGLGFRLEEGRLRRFGGFWALRLGVVEGFE